jgi:hypothetical protein
MDQLKRLASIAASLSDRASAMSLRFLRALPENLGPRVL